MACAAFLELDILFAKALSVVKLEEDAAACELNFSRGEIPLATEYFPGILPCYVTLISCSCKAKRNVLVAVFRLLAWPLLSVFRPKKFAEV